LSWAGNIYNGTLGITIGSGMTNANPQLALNADGYFGLSSSSPAIDAASASYPAILDITNIDDDPTLAFDIQGQSRPASATLKDVGCDEYATGATTNRPLRLSDVGPAYLGGPATGVLDDRMNVRDAATPSGFVLEECYPNPFNPTTVVRYQLSVASRVDLRVFDLLGREVAVLVNGWQESGFHTASFNAAGLPSGMYLCRLTTGTGSATKKMVLAK
jgi:hypothetical protein